MNANEKYNRYRALIAALAREAMAIAQTVAPLPSANPSVEIGLPAAMLLLNHDIRHSTAATAAKTLQFEIRNSFPPEAFRYDDAVGFTRPVYHPLIVRLHLLAGVELSQRALSPMRQQAKAIDLELWRCAVLAAAGEDVIRRVEAAVTQADGALRPRQNDEQIDGWTYRELAALAALHHMAVQQQPGRWLQLCAAAVEHHQQITQPDFTTHQPWAVAAFVQLSDPPLFADQQLHDARANLHLDRRSAAVTALILADAWHTLRQLGDRGS
ncbi:MAG: hypothetical protein IT445_06655 [Phycisphaeraceae bacterium]|nr:hypothetical protein [Phycisphaeraceae bacterium]